MLLYIGGAVKSKRGNLRNYNDRFIFVWKYSGTLYIMYRHNIEQIKVFPNVINMKTNIAEH